MRLLTIAIAGMLAAWSANAPATEIVRVGVVVFPPYIMQQGDKTQVELLDLMNAFQNTWHFEPVASGAMRRFRDFDLGRYDLSFYDNLSWGWQGRLVEASAVFLTGAEVYIALARPGRDDSYFANLNDKRMIGMRGYHYGFAGFNNNPHYLQRAFRMELAEDNESTIKLLLADRGDIAVVTEAYLSEYLLAHPELRPLILVSKRKDQVYAHSVIVRKGAHPNAAEINRLFVQMRKAGVLQPLWRKYGVSDEGAH